MRVEDAIKALQDCNPEEEIMIEWFTRKDVEDHLMEPVREEKWDLAVGLLQKTSGDQDNFEIQHFLKMAEERLEAAE